MKTSKAFLGALTLALGLSLSPVTHGQATITQTDLRRAEDRKLLGEIRAKAEMGDAQSQIALAHTFLTGTLGVSQNEVQAVRWYYKAAEQNSAEAQFNLGVWYANGQGVAKAYALAYKWMLLAAAQSYPNAKKQVTALEGSLSPEQIAEGQKLAGNFKPQATAGPQFAAHTQ